MYTKIITDSDLYDKLNYQELKVNNSLHTQHEFLIIINWIHLTKSESKIYIKAGIQIRQITKYVKMLPCSIAQF